jgi:hypothetical protein
MIIVRTAAGQEVAGWRVSGGPAIGGGQPTLLQPDGVACSAASFLLQGVRAAATTAAERTALERGGYLQQLRGPRTSWR